MGHTIKYSLNDASSLCNSILGWLAADSCNIVALISTILTIVWIAGIRPKYIEKAKRIMKQKPIHIGTVNDLRKRLDLE